MMRICTALMMVSLFSPVASSDFIDPMKPPKFALEKLRLEKIKKLPATKAVVGIKKKKSQQWTLNSILYSSQRQHAIVNKQLVKKGDKVDGAKVLRVASDSVRLLFKGKIINLKVNDFKARGLISGSGFKMIKKSLIEKKI